MTLLVTCPIVQLYVSSHRHGDGNSLRDLGAQSIIKDKVDGYQVSVFVFFAHATHDFTAL